MNVWLLVPICLGAMALLMAVSHGAQELVLRVWDEIDGDGSPQSDDVEHSRRHRLAHAARVAALLMAVVVLVAVVIAARVTEDKVRSIPASQALEDAKGAELDAIDESVFGPGGWRRAIKTPTPWPTVDEELGRALRNARESSPTTTAPAIP